jgi:hypothetical protein
MLGRGLTLVSTGWAPGCSGASPSNTVVLAVPVEIYEGLRRLAGEGRTASG